MIRYLIIGGFLLLFSCKKAEDRSCFKQAGEGGERIVTTDEKIDSLFLYDNLFYSLIQGTETKVELTGGENLLSHIDIKFENGKLLISNNNKCSFLRSYKNKVHAKIYVDSISYIYYEGGKELKSIDTLRSHELRLVIRDGAGSTDLTLINGYTSATVTHGFGDFTLRGETISAYLHCNTNSYCDARFFKATQALNVNSNTVGKMIVNANSNNFTATIRQSGNIEYVGNPVTSTLNLYGNGQLVHLNN